MEKFEQQEASPEKAKVKSGFRQSLETAAATAALTAAFLGVIYGGAELAYQGGMKDNKAVENLNKINSGNIPEEYRQVAENIKDMKIEAGYAESETPSDEKE